MSSVAVVDVLDQVLDLSDSPCDDFQALFCLGMEAADEELGFLVDTLFAGMDLDSDSLQRHT